MKIIFLGNYNDSEILSGPEKAAKRLFNEIAKENEIFFIEYFLKGKKGRNIFNIFFGNEQINKKRFRLGLIKQILFFRKFKPDLIHLVTFQRFTLTAIIYKLISDVKIVYTVHGIIKYENSIKKVSFFYKLKDSFVEKIIFKYSDKLLFLSKDSVELAGQYFRFKEEKISFINNGADELFYLQPVLYPYNELRLVFIGDIKREEKNFQFLISSLKEVKSKITLDVISGNPDKSNFNEFKFIKFHNFMPAPELAAFLSKKDVIISVSKFETFSISTLEGMAAGLIPVVTKETGIAKYIRNGENGFIINQNDKEKLIEIIEFLSGDVEVRKRMSAKVREIFILLNWKNVLQDLIKIYKSLLV